MSGGPRFGIANPMSHQRGLIAELLKTQLCYSDRGLEIRVEEPADFDGVRVGVKLPGREPEWRDVALPPGPDFQYGAIKEVLDWVHGLVDPPEELVATPILLPPVCG